VVDEMQKQSLARTDRFRAVGGRPRSSFEHAEVNPYAGCDRDESRPHEPGEE